MFVTKRYARENDLNRSEIGEGAHRPEPCRLKPKHSFRLEQSV